MSIRLRQIALVANKLAPVIDDLKGVFGLEVCYIDPGVGVFGLENSLLRTFTATASSAQSTTTASNLARVSRRTAESASVQVSIPTSRSLSTRRNTRMILSSVQRTSAFKSIR